MINSDTPFVLSIAGHDPSAGAGILADIKTMEANGVYGLGVCSAITFQNDQSFVGLDNLSFEQIKNQLEPLFEKYNMEVVKIGLVPGFLVLEEILNYLFDKNQNIKIIWDPILKASAGFEFHHNLQKQTLDKILNKIYLLTPNAMEAEFIFGQDYMGEISANASCAVLLKGGHISGQMATDILFYRNHQYTYSKPWIEQGAKHGSGCVLSAAIAASLAKKYSLPEACQRAKNYVNTFLATSTTLLGWHHLLKNEF